MKQMAYGALGIRPPEMEQYFWRVSPAELLEQRDAILEWKRQEVDLLRDMILTHACITVNYKDAKKPKLTVDKLLGKGEKKKKRRKKKVKPKSAQEVLGGISREYVGRWANGFTR